MAKILWLRRKVQCIVNSHPIYSALAALANTRPWTNLAKSDEVAYHNAVMIHRLKLKAPNLACTDVRKVQAQSLIQVPFRDLTAWTRSWLGCHQNVQPTWDPIIESAVIRISYYLCLRLAVDMQHSCSFFNLGVQCFISYLEARTGENWQSCMVKVKKTRAWEAPGPCPDPWYLMRR